MTRLRIGRTGDAARRAGDVVRRTGVFAATLAGLVACDSHAPVGGIPAPATYSTDVRPLAGCAAGVGVPAARASVTPRPRTGPTVSLRVGDAVTVAGPPRTRVGLTGQAQRGEAQVLCRARTSTGVVLLARAAGYVRIGVVITGARVPAVAFVRVTEA